MSRVSVASDANVEESSEAPALVPLVPPFLTEETSCVLVKIGQVMLRLVDARLEPFGLRTRHYSMLRTIIERGPMSQQELGAQLRIDKATMVSSVDLLERAGLVERGRVAHDRKRYALTATPEGRALAERIVTDLGELDDELLADLDPGQREALRTATEVLNGGPSLIAAFDRTRGE